MGRKLHLNKDVVFVIIAARLCCRCKMSAPSILKKKASSSSKLKKVSFGVAAPHQTNDISSYSKSGKKRDRHTPQSGSCDEKSSSATNASIDLQDELEYEVEAIIGHKKVLWCMCG